MKVLEDIVSIPVVVWYEVLVLVLQALQVFEVDIARGPVLHVFEYGCINLINRYSTYW